MKNKLFILLLISNACTIFSESNVQEKTLVTPEEIRYQKCCLLLAALQNPNNSPLVQIFLDQHAHKHNCSSHPEIQAYFEELKALEAKFEELMQNLPNPQDFTPNHPNFERFNRLQQRTLELMQTFPNPPGHTPNLESLETADTELKAAATEQGIDLN